MKPILQWRKSCVFFCCDDIPTATRTQVLEMLSLYLNRVVPHIVFQLFITDAKAAFTASLRLVTVIHASLNCIKFLCRGTSLFTIHLLS